jgi:hypothetical protein
VRARWDGWVVDDRIDGIEDGERERERAREKVLKQSRDEGSFKIRKGSGEGSSKYCRYCKDTGRIGYLAWSCQKLRPSRPD